MSWRLHTSSVESVRAQALRKPDPGEIDAGEVAVLTIAARQIKLEHCDDLEVAALLNGDVPTLELVERARHGSRLDQEEVLETLAGGYSVCRNEYAGRLT